jgi:tRNA U34 5-carboxymethylaminomethyl modifying GTPase MnmE/TrmE
MNDESEQERSISIGGGIQGHNVVIGSTQTVHGDLTITVGRLPAVSADLRETLQKQIEELIEAMKTVPASETKKVQEVKIAVEDAVSEANKKQPDKNRLEIRGEALKKAAQSLAEITPIVLKIASQVATTIMGII